MIKVRAGAVEAVTAALDAEARRIVRRYEASVYVRRENRPLRPSITVPTDDAYLATLRHIERRCAFLTRDDPQPIVTQTTFDAAVEAIAATGIRMNDPADIPGLTAEDIAWIRYHEKLTGRDALL